MSGGGSTSTTTQELSPEQQQLLAIAMPTAKEFAANPPDLFNRSSVAGFTPLQQKAQTSATSMADTLGNYIGGARDANQQVQNTALPAGLEALLGIAQGGNIPPVLQWMINGGALNPDSNPSLQKYGQSMVGNLSDELQQKVLPGIRGGAQTAGQVGSSRQGIAEGLALGDFNQQAGTMLQGLYSNAYGQGLDATNKGLGTYASMLGLQGDAGKTLLGAGQQAQAFMPELAQLSLMPSQILDAVGQQQQRQQQLILSDEINRYQQEQMLPFLLAQDIANMAMGLPGGTATTNQSTKKSPLEIALGIGSMFAGFGF